MKDPYKVLGIDRNATPEQIKKAYRAASRQYHPDANPDNPKFAEEMFKEIQQAYRDIIEGNVPADAGRTGAGGMASAAANRQTPTGGRTTYAGYGQRMGSSAGSNGKAKKKYYGQPGKPICEDHDSRELKDAAACINAGCYKEAIKILESIALRGEKWYYFSAIAHKGAGNNVMAQQYIDCAIFMDPQNPDYTIYKQKIVNDLKWYQKQNSMYGKPSVNGGISWSEILMRLICMFC